MTNQNPPKVRTRGDLAEFVRNLAADLKQRPEAGENADLGAFLEAASAWNEDMDGYYQTRGESVPSQPDWRTLAEILAAARVYE